MQELKILEGAEEFSFNESATGGTGVLLIHGFTGSPQSTRPLGEYLGDKGLPVVGIRLPGHGTTWEDLNTRTAADWVGTVDAALDQMTARHERVFLVGLSFGVALSLDAAARRPADVAGIVEFCGLRPSPEVVDRFRLEYRTDAARRRPALSDDERALIAPSVIPVNAWLGYRNGSVP